MKAQPKYIPLYIRPHETIVEKTAIDTLSRIFCEMRWNEKGNAYAQIMLTLAKRTELVISW